MLEILTSLLNMVIAFSNWVIHQFQALLVLLGSIPQIIGILTSIFSSMPPFVFPFIILAVYLMLMLKWVLNK